MSRVITVFIIFFVLLSCKKERNHNDSLVDTASLHQFISNNEPSLLEQIDWSKIIVSQSAQSFYRVGLRDKDFGKHFLLFRQNDQGNIVGARIIKLNIDYNSLDGVMENRAVGKALVNIMKLRNGFIIPADASVSGAIVASSAVEDNSYLTPPMLAKLFPDPRSGDNAPDYNALYYINIRQSYEALASPSSYYQLTTAEKKNDYGGQTYTSSATGYPTTISVDVDRGYESATIIDVDKMIQCFNSVPDQGAACSIEIFADLPVNDQPGYLADMKQQYAGHCFLQLKKSNQGKSITQNIGLYPKVSIKSLATTSPIPGRFLDDSNHGYNASLKMSLNFGQLAVILQAIKRHKDGGLKYDLDNYNCTDFALNIINLVRPDQPIHPKRYVLPGGPATVSGTNLPQGVFGELVMLMKTSVADRKNINISTTNLYSNVTTTPCK